MAIAPISIASSTASNWLKEAQESLIASANPGGLLGTLQSAAKGGDGSIKSFLTNSETIAANFALISSSTTQAAFNLTLQMADAAAQKRADDKLNEQLKQLQQPVNYTPPHGLDPIIYFEDGTTIDTVNNILTKPDGKQIDTTTGQPYIEPGSLIQMANGAYLDTKNNILTMPDGTKIDTITGLTITV
jgi:hypothetical protein